MEYSLLVLLFIGVVVVFMAVKIVPQQQAWVIETFGKFDKINQDGGLIFLIPVMQRIAYKHSLKEQVIDVQEQTAITRDNVAIRIDGVLYVKVINAMDASYGVSDPYLAVSQLAQTTMRAEIGKMPLDKTFEERDHMNANIVSAINEAAGKWGVQCMRYEIRDIHPPATVKEAMEMQMVAERQKRADIYESEGKRQAQINLAEGQKQEVVLESEAAQTDQINRAKGEAEAIRQVATATADGIRDVAAAINEKGGSDAVSLRVAEQYVSAFAKLAKESNTVLLPTAANDAGSMVAQAMTIFDSLKKPKKPAA